LGFKKKKLFGIFLEHFFQPFERG